MLYNFISSVIIEMHYVPWQLGTSLQKICKTQSLFYNFSKSNGGTNAMKLSFLRIIIISIVIIIIGPKESTVLFLVSFPEQMYNCYLFQIDLMCSELSVALIFMGLVLIFDLKVLQILVLILHPPTQAQKCCLGSIHLNHNFC